MAVISLALLLGVASAAFVAPPVRHTSSRRATRVAFMAADGASEEGGEAMLPASEMAKLQARIQRIQENGLATPGQKLFELATEQSPQQLMSEFFLNTSPSVVEAMQQAVVGLLGKLPPYEFDAQITTTGDKLAALMLQLQMTGYMLRNAEYVITVRKLLQLKTRSAAEYRAAFERLDTDSSGYIEVAEVQTLLKEVYEGDVPPFEVSAFMSLFDGDGDGRISQDEFERALGVDGASEAPAALGLLPSSTEGEGTLSVSPKLSGNITVLLDDGSEVEMDASAYMEQLKQEALALRAELGKMAEASTEEIAASSSAIGESLTAYVASLQDDQLQLLTSGISDDVVDAMKQLIAWILRAPSGDGELEKDAEVVMEQQKLQQLCLYQLILGYRLREAEATGDANEQIGK